MLEIELFNLLEGTSDAAFAVTDQGEICSWNKAAEKLFGYTAEEALNKTCASRRVSTSLRPVFMEFSEYFHLS
jgi:PAS domain S-box-containing protein